MTISLLIDLGNTRLKWGINEGSSLRKTGGGAYQACELITILNEVDKPDAIFLASVAKPKVTKACVEACQQLWNITPETITTPTEAHGLKNSYAVPENLGIDRWLASIAAYHQAQNTVCIIDCGSAITVDLVDKEGIHQGGWIVMGYQKQLAEFSNQFPQLADNDLNERTIELTNQTDTAKAIQSGCQLQTVAFINQAFTQAKQILGQGTQCFITGGDAVLFLPHLSHQPVHEPHLVLKGLQHFT